MKISSLFYQLNRRDSRIVPRLPMFTKFALIVIAIVGVSLFTKNIFAQSNILKEKQDAISKGNNQEAWMSEALTNNIVSMTNLVAGTIPFNADGTVKTSFVPGGAIGYVSQLTASLYTPPASGVEYIASVKDTFLGKPAYAQGVGFKGLQPILPIWKIFRDMVYVLSSIFFLIIGIMLMLRVKVSPQAVITVQSAIPRIFSTLILITFSYAIAGLVIDLMNVFQGIILAAIFNGQGGLAKNLFINGSFHPSFGQLANPDLGTTSALMWKALPLGTLYGIMAIVLASLLSIIGLATGGIPGAIVGGVVGAILPILIIAITIFVLLFIFFFGLLKCYVNVLFQIIFAPLIIASGALPNAKSGFSSWILKLVGNLAVFPASIVFLVIINLIIDTSTGKDNMWLPSLMTGGFQSIAISPSTIIPLAVSLVGIFMLAKLPSVVPELIFQIKPDGFGKAVGESFKSSTGASKFIGASTGGYLGGIVEDRAGHINANGAQKAMGSIVGAARMFGIIPKKSH